ncbi:MAG: LysM peptidoglycan-binding domain-containing protein [Acidimicrobiales bacterium]
MTGSLLTALVVFAATPTVLVVVVGSPLGHGLGHQWGQGVRIALTALAALTWVAWAACCAQLTRSIAEQVRRGQASAPTGALAERIAARIAGGVLSLIALAAPLTLTSAAGASALQGGAPAIRAEVHSLSSSPMPVAAPSVDEGPATVATYTVRTGDSLWSIADAQLGAGDDWPAIAALNLGRTMADGLTFVDPNRIYAGWTLEMPDPHPLVASRAVALPVRPESDIVSPRPSTNTTASRRPPDGAPARSGRREEDTAGGPASTKGAGPGRLGLPELAALGVGAIGAAALARRVRRVRQLQLLAADEGGTVPAPSGATIDTDVLLARFVGTPAERSFETANCALGRALARAGASTPRVRIRTICVGADGVDFWIAGPPRPAPGGFTTSEGGNAWRATHDALTVPIAARPMLPIVLPVGEDDSGTWLIPLGPGDCLPLMGEAAGELWQAARAVQESWSWADMVLVTDDPRAAAEEVRLQGGDGHEVLFAGDPASLSPSLARAVSVVSLSPAPASDVTVLVDRLAATIHPLGRTVRPHLMTSATWGRIGRLVDIPGPAADDAPTIAEDPDPVPTPVAYEEANSPPADGGGGSTLSNRWGPGQGTVEVKLLTTTPRLEGLHEPLPLNRARRAVELVAYLALHKADEVTSDRLRTRVLGSADADAASKTLFNIAAAARRALGDDDSGMPLLPPGSRTGRYRVAEQVTVDVHRAASLAAEGNAAEDPKTAMAHLRCALSLVEGEPMANALSGYAWWEAEGHAARIAAVLVNAAGNLAALAVDAGLFDLAQWGLDQARMVDPYSEAISRAAMQVAAAAGDADRLRREWRECQRRIDELDPGSTPSPRTERLYGELARRVLVGATRTAEE